MEKYQADFTDIARMLDPDRLPLKGNEHKLVRVAFDMFRLDGDEADDLWQVQADDDGNEFLVRTYALDGEDNKVAEASDWSVLADKKYANLTVSFKDMPLTRIASKDFGAENPRDGKSLQGIIFKKLSSNGAFALKLIGSLPQEKISALRQAGLLEIITELIDKVTPECEETSKKHKESDEQEAVDPKKGPSIPVGNLANEDQEWSLAFLNLHLTKTARGESNHEKFMEDIDPNSGKKNLEKIKILDPNDKQALEVIMEAKING